MQKILNAIKKCLIKPELSQEAFSAYYHRLPESIKTVWKRDGNFIVGEVIDDKNNKIMTQGRNAREFIEMVNDAVYTAYDIPENYLEVINKSKAYNPSPEERARLENGDIKESSALIKKEGERALRLA